MPRKKVCLLTIVLVLLLFLSALIYYFLFTTKGSSAIAKFTLSRYLEPQNIDIEKIEGNLSETLSFYDLELENLKGLPEGSTIRIQKLEISFTSFNPGGLNIRIDNGRLKLPDSEPILFYGSYRESSLDINVYSKQVYLRSFFDSFTEGKLLSGVSGTISDIDIYTKGPLLEPELTGTFQIVGFSRNDFSLDNCPGSFGITLKNIKDDLRLFGEIVLKSGEVSGPKSTVIELKTCKILFFGNPKMPALDLKGVSIIEGTKIEIVLKGTMDKPDLQLKSEPPMPQERLLLMLTTGKSWKGTEAALSQGQISADLARDFLDYFVLAGSGSKIAQHLGISDISLKYDSQTKGIGVKKAISEKLEASYGVEQHQSNGKESITTHKVGGEYKITESIAVGAEKELEQDKINIQKKSQTNDKVILKYKKGF